jgi:hypothetical protein
MSKCEADISGNPSPCQDGCVEAYAAATKNITLCNTLADQTNLPSCYGTVVKAVGNISICDTLPNTTDIDYCLSEAGRSG